METLQIPEGHIPLLEGTDGVTYVGLFWVEKTKI